MDERRLHPRLNLPLESHYCLDGSELEQTATMLDLSAGGAGLRLPRELETGAQLDFRFVLPPDGGRPATPILARAEVVRTERHETEEGDFGFLTGLKFIELGADSLQRIQQFVFARLTKGQPQTDEMPLERKRVEFHKPISIRFDRFDDFESEVSENLSLGGMFIRSNDPKPPGTVFTFEHQLGDDFPLVSGRAEVVWTRSRGHGPAMPQGMGVRFLDLDGSSRNVIRRLVESKLPEGEISGVAEDRRATAEPKPHRVPRPVKKSAPTETEPRPAEIDTLRHEMARRTKEFSEQEERLKRQIIELTNREVEHQDRLRANQSALGAAETKARELEGRLAERDRRLVDAGHELEGLRARLSETSHAREALALELETRASARQDELATMRANLEATHSVEAERLGKIEELEGENSAARRQLEDFAGEIATARRRVEDLEYREAELRKDNEELRGDLERARKALRENADDAKREAGSRAELVRKVEAQDTEIDTLRHDLAQSIEAGHDAEKLLLAELGSTRTDFERLGAELDSARARASEKETAESELRDQLDKALSELERERENSEKSESKLRAELLQAVAKADQLAVENADAAELGTALRQARSEHEKTVEALEAEQQDKLEALEAEHQDRIEALEAKHQDKIEALEAVNRGLNAKIARLEAVEEREPQPPTAELLLEPVVPIADIAPQPYPGGPRPSRRRSRVAIAAILGVVAVAAALLSPLGERVRSAASGLFGADSPAPSMSQTDAQQDERRTRLGGSASETESEDPAGTAPEVAASTPESPVRDLDETGALEPKTEIAASPELDPIEEPAVMVAEWAQAWSEQRVEDYLGFYARDFVPANGLSRAGWEAQRRERLTAPQSILVRLDAIRQEITGEGNAEVVFDQSYEADAYSDRVRKTFKLVLESGGWRIASETAQPIP